MQLKFPIYRRHQGMSSVKHVVCSYSTTVRTIKKKCVIILTEISTTSSNTPPCLNQTVLTLLTNKENKSHRDLITFKRIFCLKKILLCN